MVDEISMLGAKMLHKVNRKCNKIWSTATTSDAIMGGLPIVIFLGDFNQFEPVKDTALWRTEETAKDSIVNEGLDIWKKFTNVIILTEQMRQKDDLEYQKLLHRATTCTLTEDDIQLLNTRSKSNLLSKNMRVPDLAIRPRNEERHDFNRLAVERFAAERNQKVWMFAASHSRPRGNTQTSYISVGSMLNHGDGGKFKGPGIFFFTPGMPVMLLENLMTPMKLVNGRIGTAIDIVIDPKGLVLGSPLHDDTNFCTAEIFDLNDRYVLSSLPPACVLVEYDQPTGLSFQGLAPNVHPFFPRKHSGEIKDLFTKRGVSVRRCQVSQTPAFAITDYKAQGHTMEELEVDIGFDKMTYGSAHYKWTSLNLQLRRATNFKGLCLRDSITLSDVRFRPDERLATEMARLEQLSAATEQRWHILVGEQLGGNAVNLTR
jgi:hypothetical protein